MKHVSKSQAKKFQNGATSDVLEYSLGDPDIDIAIATINGNYPEKTGYVINEECKELLYVVSGSGTFVTKDESAQLNQGDQVLIEKGELFRYEACDNLVIVAACTPAWSPDQHKEVNT